MINKQSLWPSNTTTALVLLAIFILSIWIQSHIFLCWDIDWLIHAANRLLAGGNYYRDFFEVNSPMAIFIHIPAVLASKYYHISFATSFRIDVFISIIICLALSYYLLKILLINDPLLVKWLIICLGFVLLLYPFSQFGQREHVLIILALPYILLVGIRCKNIPIHTTLTLLISVLAAIAINIKPYFLILWLTLECYLICYQKTWRTLIRSENLIIVTVSCIYLGLIIIFTPEYITKVLPIISKMYYVAYQNPWKAVILNYAVIFYGICSIYYLLARKTSSNPLFLDLCQLSASAFFIIYLWQHVAWHYHSLPFVTMCCLMAIVLIYDYLTKPSFLPANTYWTEILDRMIHIMVIVVLFIALPCNVFFIGTLQSLSLYNDSYNQKIINFIIEHSNNQPVYFFSNNMDAYIVVDKSHTICGSRFACLWMINGIYNAEKHPLTTQQHTLLLAQENFLRNAVVEDLNHYHPALLFFVLNDRDLVNYQNTRNNWPKLKTAPINYWKFFNSDSRFNDIMKHYTNFGTVGNYQVYKRNTT